jgi:hypothetical protein
MDGLKCRFGNLASSAGGGSESLLVHHVQMPRIRTDAGTVCALAHKLQYLAEHGLVNSGVRKSQSGDTEDQWYEVGTKITAKGLDFLADDGGLSALLGAGTKSK